MLYDEVWDKWKEECGVFGIYDRELPIAKYIYWGLFALQHRGQESAGIAVGDGTSIEVAKGLGVVTEAFRSIPPFSGFVGCGHVRYSTTGKQNEANIQPLLVRYRDGEMALAHNGNLVNTLAVRQSLEQEGVLFQTTTDSEVLANLIARSHKESMVERIQEACQQIEGAYSLVICAPDALYGVRDPHGYRPLSLGRTKTGGYILSSETCAFLSLSAEFERDIKPGEIVEIQGGRVTSYPLVTNGSVYPPQMCSFEYIYFARPDSKLDSQNVYETRLAMGVELAKEATYEADLVIGVPDSGRPAAQGFAMQSKLPLVEGLIRNRYMGRTFIKPDQEERELAVRMKLNAMPDVLAGKRVVVVDDSIVRGTTSKIIIKLLKEAGAKEVYMAISSPPVTDPCYYGIDTSGRGELIAATHSVEEVARFIGADILQYLSMEGLCRAVEMTEGPVKREHLCYSCFTGKYATNPMVDGGGKDVFERGEKDNHI